MDGLFADISNEEHFVNHITKSYEQVPRAIRSVMWCEQTVDAERVQHAFTLYTQNIETFKLYLASENPDHYKRAGALLHALYKSNCVIELKLESSSEELDAGYTRVAQGDAEAVISFVTFYEVYHNQLLAFDTAYRCCVAYEDDPQSYDFDYLHNVCRYLQANNNLSLDSMHMLFKSLMLK